MAAIKFSWLGHPLIQLNGAPVKLEMRKSIALLAYLSLKAEEISREALACLFWSDYDQQHALANLRRNLFSLNKSLPDIGLDALRDSINLNDRSNLWVDIDEFLHLLASIEEHPHGNLLTCSECQANLEAALSLYRGDFLEGFNLKDCPDFDDWQLFQRESLRKALSQALEQLAEIYLSQAKWEQGISIARRWVSLDHLHEPAQRALMNLYASAGQRSAALRQFDDYARLLKEELGEQPETETLNLLEKIRVGELIPYGTPVKKVTPPEPVYPMEPLLKTKFFIPAGRPNLVHRNRLEALLKEGAGRALTLLSAPAGFGKTTLLVEWIASSTIPTAWLSLDQEDNEPARFLAYLLAALENVLPGVGNEARAILQNTQNPFHPSLLTVLVNKISEIDKQLTLILDDYQNITDSQVQDAVAFLVEHIPPCLHLMIATRADPRLPLARLRARDQLTAVRAVDLKFTLEETAEFLNQTMGLSLSVEDIRALESRTEGWAAGLQMAALSLQGRQDTSQFIQAFSGSHRYVLDYLVEEVLNRQPAEIQQFLLYTSILDKLNAALCDELLAIESGKVGSVGGSACDGKSRATLKYLDRSNLFLVPLDENCCDYRYHQLFSDLLRARLQQFFPDTAQKLHQRAARWYEQNGFTIEALNHALLGGDYERAARLVEQGAMIMLARGEIVTIKNWIARLPADLVKSRPWLCIFNAWSFMVIGQHERAEAFLKIAEQLSGIGGGITDFAAFNEERRDEIGHIAAVRAHVACTKGETQLAIELAAKALEVLSAGNQVVRSSLAFVLGEAYFFNGMLDKAEQAWTEAARQSKENGVVHVTMPAMSELAKICKIRGELNRAADLYWDALQLVKEQGEQRFYVLGPIDIGLADLMREWNFLEAASCGLSEGIMRSEKWGSPNAIVFGYVTLARLLHAQNDLQKTSEALQKAEDLAEHSNIYPDVICELNKSRVQFWLEQGRLSDANNWLAEKEKAQSVDKCYGLETMTRARVYIALGKPAKALEMLRPVEQIAKENGYTGIKIEALVIQSMAYKANDQPAQALAALREALTAGMTEDYVRIFVGEGKPVISLLSILNRQITSADPLRPYIEKLLAAVEKGDETDNSLAEERLASDYGVARCAEDGFVLVEALSERELEVLSLISDGLTNSDIAKELYISTGTVRAHTASIYRKLDVSSRTQAVARARSLNLLQNQK